MTKKRDEPANFLRPSPKEVESAVNYLTLLVAVDNLAGALEDLRALPEQPLALWIDERLAAFEVVIRAARRQLGGG